jgi:hypothetical protein
MGYGYNAETVSDIYNQASFLYKKGVTTKAPSALDSLTSGVNTSTTTPSTTTPSTTGTSGVNWN